MRRHLITSNPIASPYGRFVIPILMLFLMVFSLSSCKKSSPKPPPPPEVEVVDVMQKDVPIQHEWVGTLDGFVNAVIRAQVTGYLIRQNYKEGDHVKKGQVLFEIDPRPFEAALNQAKGSLAQAEAQYANAKANYARIKPLVGVKALSEKDLDDATAALRSTQAQLVASRAAVKTAELNLGFTRIVSPIDGIAGIAQAQVGNLVGPSQTGQLTTVSTIDPMKVFFTVSEQDYIAYVRKSSPASASLETPAGFQIELVLSDGSTYPRKGRFFAADRQIDPRTGTLLVEAVFPNPDSLLRPGQFGRVRVTVGIRRDALLIPQKSVIELQGKFQAAVVSPDNHVEIRNVRPGPRFGELQEIDEGLKPGERVVAEGMQKVKEGGLVTPKPYVARGPEGPPGQKPGGQAAGGAGE